MATKTATAKTNTVNTITHERELITPEIAKKYLASNITNRRLRKDRVNAIARDIKNGNWKETHQGIAFDTNGDLIDGQHRLAAIVEADVGVYIDVARGLPYEIGSVIDTGSARTCRDSIVFDSRYANDPAMKHKDSPAMIKALIRNEIPFLRYITNNEVFTVMEALAPEIHKMYPIAITRVNYISSAIKAAGLAAIICGESEDDLFRFFNIFCSGDDSETVGRNSAIVWNWKEQILKAKMHGKSFTQEALYNGTQNAIYNFCRNTNTKVVKMTSEHRYNARPRLVEIINNADIGVSQSTSK